tara:strand:+ start:454 stop:744 length:291 start_codon:yes stop_codon:yes gene_type:complete
MYLDIDIINILWKAGCTNMEMIYKIININKLEKIKENNKLTEESRKFYMELDNCGYYCLNPQSNYNSKDDAEYWKLNALWLKLHRELLLWNKYFSK